MNFFVVKILWEAPQPNAFPRKNRFAISRIPKAKRFLESVGSRRGQHNRRVPDTIGGKNRKTPVKATNWPVGSVNFRLSEQSI